MRIFGRLEVFFDWKDITLEWGKSEFNRWLVLGPLHFYWIRWDRVR